MARSRNIKPGFFANDEIVDLDFWVRLLFIGLWTLADREGRLEDRPKKIKMSLFPADPIDAEDGLSKLHDAKFIQRYEVDGVQYIQIVNFKKHQNPHKNEVDSDIPPYVSGELPNKSVSVPIKSEPLGLVTDSLNLVTDSLNPETTTLALCASPKRESVEVLPDGFAEFYAAYPRKKSKLTAIRAWLKIKPNEQTRTAIMAGLSRAMTSADWTHDGGKFIPHPATWLNAGGWEDDTSVVALRPKNRLAV